MQLFQESAFCLVCINNSFSCEAAQFDSTRKLKTALMVNAYLFSFTLLLLFSLCSRRYLNFLMKFAGLKYNSDAM